MTLQSIDPMIRSIGLPCAYYAFKKPEAGGMAQAPPYIVYLSPGRSDLFADDTNYQHILDLDIELYTKTKRYDLEVAVETALTNNGLTYGKTETFIESDGVFQITYETEILITYEDDTEEIIDG